MSFTEDTSSTKHCKLEEQVYMYIHAMYW